MSKVIGYSRTQIAVHWAIALLLVASYLSSDAMKAAWIRLHQGGDAYGNVAAAHVWGGVAVLVLACVRIAVRLGRGAPALPPVGHPLAERVAKLTHIGLYALVVAIPAAGVVAWFLGLDAAGEAHEVLFNLLVALVGLHVAGALYHHFVLKDGLIWRMKRAG